MGRVVLSAVLACNHSAGKAKIQTLSVTDGLSISILSIVLDFFFVSPDCLRPRPGSKRNPAQLFATCQLDKRGDFHSHQMQLKTVTFDYRILCIQYKYKFDATKCTVLLVALASAKASFFNLIQGNVSQSTPYWKYNKNSRERARTSSGATTLQLTQFSFLCNPQVFWRNGLRHDFGITSRWIKTNTHYTKV